MNKERRSRIRGLIKAFKDLSSTIQNDLSSQVQDLHDLEEEAFDNMPESMQTMASPERKQMTARSSTV